MERHIIRPVVEDCLWSLLRRQWLPGPMQQDSPAPPRWLDPSELGFLR